MSDEEWAEVPGSEGTIVVRTLPDGSARYRVAVEAVPALVEGLRGKLNAAEARVRELEEALRPFATRAGRSVNRLDAFWHGDWDIVERARRLLGLEVDRG